MNQNRRFLTHTPHQLRHAWFDTQRCRWPQRRREKLAAAVHHNSWLFDKFFKFGAMGRPHLHPTDIAEDGISELCTSILLGKPHYLPEWQTFTGFWSTIAYRYVVSRLRSHPKKRRQVLCDTLQAVETIPCQSLEVQEAYDRIVATLSRHERLLTHLLWEEEIPATDVAIKLKRPHATIRKTASRLRQRLLSQFPDGV